MRYQNVIKKILQEEEDLTEIVQLVGKDSLSEDQKAVLEVAKVIREDYLQQNAFSDYDYNCPLYKTIGMMKCIVCFFENSKRAITESQMSEKKISWAVIIAHLEEQFLELSQMKFKDPLTPVELMNQYFDKICDDIDSKFRDLVHAA